MVIDRTMSNANSIWKAILRQIFKFDGKTMNLPRMLIVSVAQMLRNSSHMPMTIIRRFLRHSRRIQRRETRTMKNIRLTPLNISYRSANVNNLVDRKQC